MQSPIATKLIDGLSADTPGFIGTVVMVELVWVLQACYHSKRGEIAQILEKLLRSKELIVEETELAWKALNHFSSTRADFADCLIGLAAQRQGCDETVTFDKGAVPAGMRLIG